MFKGRIADINVGFEEYYKLFHAYIPEFAAEFDKPDLVIEVTQKDIEEERAEELAAGGKDFPPGRFQMTRAFRKFGDAIPDFNAVVMHGCFVSVGDRGIAFIARSGTGKTTHMLLWQKLLGERLQIINGDKPIVRFIDGGLFGYGTPWNGKEHFFVNGRAPLTDICIIERGEKNETLPVSKDEGALALIQQVHTPRDPEQLTKTMQLVSRISEQCRFWKIRCNMDIEAAEVAYGKICGGYE